MSVVSYFLAMSSRWCLLHAVLVITLNACVGLACPAATVRALEVGDTLPVVSHEAGQSRGGLCKRFGPRAYSSTLSGFSVSLCMTSFLTYLGDPIIKRGISSAKSTTFYPDCILLAWRFSIFILLVWLIIVVRSTVTF